MLVDEKGNVTVKTDKVRQGALSSLRKLAPVPCRRTLRPWDDASQQQVAGGRQRCADHEPAERLGGGQARCAAGGRAVLDARLPVGGRNGRFAPFLPYLWGI